MANGDVTEGEIGNDEPQQPKNITMICAYKGDPVRFLQCFANEDDPHHEVVADQINARSELDDGRTPLDIAAMLGRTEMVRELIEKEADINSSNVKGMLKMLGYSC